MRPAPMLTVLLAGCLMQPQGKLPEPPIDTATFMPLIPVPVKGDYTVWIRDCHDGDTFTACMLVPVKVRLHGVNAPELSTPGGKPSRDFLAKQIVGRQLPCRFYGLDKYGRHEGDIRVDGGWLSETMIGAGHAVKWDGNGPRP